MLWASVQSAVYDTACGVHNVRHVGQHAVGLVDWTIQRINQDRPPHGQPRLEKPGVLHLLPHAGVMRDLFSWVSLARVDEYKGEALVRVTLCQIFQGWRRQPAVRSGDRAELHNRGARPPILG